MRKAGFLVAGLMLLAVGAASSFAANRTLNTLAEPARTTLRDDRIALVENDAARISGWMDNAKTQVQRVSDQLSPWSPIGDQIELRTKLDRLGAVSPSLELGFFVVDKQNRVVAASSANTGLIGFFRGGGHISSARSGQVSISNVLVEPFRGKAVVAVAAPITGRSGDVASVIVGMTPVAEGSLGTLIKSMTKGSDRFAVVDPASVVVDSQPPPDAIEPVGANEAIPKNLAKKSDRPGFVEYKGEGGEARVAAYAPLAGGWTAVYSRPASGFYTSTYGPVNVGTTIVTVLIALMIAVATVLRIQWARALRRSDVAKRAFLAVAGHELRTPLTVIRGFGQTLLKRWGNIDDRERKQILETIAQQSRNLEHLVERLMTASQLEAGFAGSPLLRTNDLGPVLQRAADHLQSLSVIHDVVVDIPEEGLWAEVDPKFFDQALLHVLENAVKFSPSGGMVKITGAVSGKSVSVTVEDEGVGLPADISGLFERFSQSERVETRTNEEGGVGLGLYIARSLLLQMRGTIQAGRRTPKGATFIIKVPKGRMENAPFARFARSPNVETSTSPEGGKGAKAEASSLS